MEPTTTLEGGTPSGSTGNVSGAVDASTLAIQAGGNKGGKPRKDGLTPGSAEALEADRKKDAERKRKARAGIPKEPPPLPPALEPVKVDGTPPPPSGPSVVPWSPDTLAPLFKEVIPLIENTCIDGLTERAKKAGFGPAMVEEVRRDARWNETAKAGLLSAGPQVAAKYLSKTGIPADAAPEVILGTSMLAIYIGHRMLCAKLEDMAKDKGDKPQPQNAEAQ